MDIIGIPTVFIVMTSRAGRSNGDPLPQAISMRNQQGSYPGKKSARRSIRSFFFWGRSRYRGRLITTYAHLIIFFGAALIQRARLSVASLRCYLSSLEGTGTTRETIIPDLISYHNARKSHEHYQNHRDVGHSLESQNRQHQIIRTADTDYPAYTCPDPPHPKTSKR